MPGPRAHDPLCHPLREFRTTRQPHLAVLTPVKNVLAGRPFPAMPRKGRLGKAAAGFSVVSQQQTSLCFLSQLRMAARLNSFRVVQGHGSSRPQAVHQVEAMRAPSPPSCLWTRLCPPRVLEARPATPVLPTRPSAHSPDFLSSLPSSGIRRGLMAGPQPGPSPPPDPHCSRSTPVPHLDFPPACQLNWGVPKAMSHSGIPIQWGTRATENVLFTRPLG